MPLDNIWSGSAFRNICPTGLFGVRRSGRTYVWKVGATEFSLAAQDPGDGFRRHLYLIPAGRPPPGRRPGGAAGGDEVGFRKSPDPGSCAARLNSVAPIRGLKQASRTPSERGHRSLFIRDRSRGGLCFFLAASSAGRSSRLMTHGSSRSAFAFRFRPRSQFRCQSEREKGRS